MWNKNYIWILSVIVFSILGCIKSKPRKYIYEEQISDSILAIQINNDFWIHWNQNSFSIQEDSLLDSVKAHFEETREDLSYRICNLGKTNAKACKRDLFMGDMVLLLIMKIGNIDNNHTIRKQFCVHDMGCPYPQGFFELVDKDRERIAERVLLYYQR